MESNNIARCPNCDMLFHKGEDYPQSLFCCSHCYQAWLGNICPDPQECQACLDNLD